MHVAFAFTESNARLAGGVARVVLERARFLVAEGHRVTLVCRGTKGLVDREWEPGIAVRTVPHWGRLYEWPFARLHTFSPTSLRAYGTVLDRVHAETPIDLVDVQDGPTILGVERFCRRRGVPMTLTIHSSPRLNPAPRPWIGRRLHVWYEARAHAAAAHVIAISAYMASVPAYHGLPDAAVTVVPNPVPEDCIEDRPPRPFHTPAALLFVGRVSAEKGCEVLVRALARLPQGTARLTVVGDGPALPGVKALARELGVAEAIDFQGFVYDRVRLKEHMRAADVLVFPSLYEPQGLALMEGVAMGLHPVAADIPAVAEFLPAAYLYPATDPAALTERIAAVVAAGGSTDDDRAVLRARIEERRARVVLPRLLDCYRRVVDEAARKRSAVS